MDKVDNAAMAFSNMLNQKAKDRTLKKTERTRYLILSMLAHRFEFHPTAKVTVESILEETGLSRGTFYNHFKDVDECIYVLFQLFMEQWDDRVRSPQPKDLFASIFEVNHYYCVRYEQNAPLFAAYTYYAAGLPDLLALRNRINSDWVKRIVSTIRKKTAPGLTSTQVQKLEGCIKMLVAMTIETLRERYINCDDMLTQAFKTSEELTHAISRQWYPVLAKPEEFLKELELRPGQNNDKT
jgi:AcrR family transcriptional regulator